MAGQPAPPWRTPLRNKSLILRGAQKHTQKTSWGGMWKTRDISGQIMIIFPT